MNTQDGSCWMRRAVTRDGHGLYALAGTVAGAPDEVLATIPELAADHKLASMAFALPMPVGPAPQTDADLAKAPWGRGEDGRPRLPMGAHWTDIPELVDGTVAKIQGRVNRATSGHWYDASLTEAWRAPGTVCTRVDGYHRTVGQVTNMLSADVDLVLHAHDDLTWCLEMLAKFRAEISALRAERHSTNEAPDDAAQELRTRPATPAKGRALLNELTVKRAEATHWKRLGLEDPHESPLHRRDLIPHDLPEIRIPLAAETEVEPSGCRYCGIPARVHGRQEKAPVGWHQWVLPTQAQIKARMRARRAARTGGAR